MLEIKFDPTNTAVASAIGAALCEIAGAISPRALDDGLPKLAPDASTLGAIDAFAVMDTLDTVDIDRYLGDRIKREIVKETDAGNAVETATEQATTTESESTATADKPAGKKTKYDGTTDPKGVPFDVEFCAVAADPFYKTGANKDQWKKRQGVTQERYQQWYTANLPMNDAPEEEDTSGAAAGAFGNNQQEQQPACNNEPVFDGTDADVGKLMTWVTEMQTAGKLTHPDMENAYKASGFTAADLFDPAKRQDAVKAVFDIISKVVQNA